MTKHAILFLAANPLCTDRLALDEEARAIQEELERSGHSERFELMTRWAVRPLDLLRALRKLKPTVVHFSGHGGYGAFRPGGASSRDIVSETIGNNDASASDQEHGLFFQGSDRHPQLVSTTALQETFGAVGGSVKLVVLSACYSDAQAEMLLRHVAGVVGMGGSIRDEAARSFAVGFYGGLGEGQSVAAAHRQGCAAIGLEGMPDGGRPQLRVRAGTDAEQFVVTPITRPGPAGGSRVLWVAVAVAVVVAVCAPAAWLTVLRHQDSSSVILAPPPPKDPGQTLAPNKPILDLPPTRDDCKRMEAASPMCSYRGTLRKMNGAPMSNIKVELTGTDCTVITTELGIFDFKTCNLNQTRRLKHPSIFLHLTEGQVCKEIPLQDPPLVSEILLDLKTCHKQVFIKPAPSQTSPWCQQMNKTICQHLYACYSPLELAASGFPASERVCWLRAWKAICPMGGCYRDDKDECIRTFEGADCSVIRKAAQQLLHPASPIPDL